jgi:WD40 repeat protein
MLSVQVMFRRPVRIATPAAPRFEPAFDHGTHAVVDDTLWLSSPDGILVCSLPDLAPVDDRLFPERVDSFALSGDGRLLAILSGREDPTITIRDARTGRRRAVLRDATLGDQVALSACGRYLALNAHRMLPTSVLWTLEDGVPTGPPRKFRGWISFAPDERAIALANHQGIALVRLDTPGAEPTTRLASPEPSITALAWSPTGETLAVAYEEQPSRVSWLARLSVTDKDPECPQRLPGRGDPVTGLAFAPTGALAVNRAAGFILEPDGSARCEFEGRWGEATWWDARGLIVGKARPVVIDPARGTPVASYHRLDAPRAERVSFSDGALVTWHGSPRATSALHAWDLETGLLRPSSPPRRDGVADGVPTERGLLELVPVATEWESCMGEDLVTSEGALEVHLESAHTSKNLGQLCEHPGHIHRIEHSADGTLLLTVGGGVARFSRPLELRSDELEVPFDVRDGHLSADERGFVLLGDPKRADGSAATSARKPPCELVYVLNLEGGILARAAGPAVEAAALLRLELLAIARPDHSIDVLGSMTLLRRITHHRARIRSLAFTPSGRALAVADDDGVVWVHEIPRSHIASVLGE